jgi:hypothetical protein
VAEKAPAPIAIESHEPSLLDQGLIVGYVLLKRANHIDYQLKCCNFSQECKLQGSGSTSYN